MSPEARKTAVRLLGFAPGSVGSLMTPNYVCVSKGWTVQQVLDHVRKTGQDSETLTMIYVVDEEHRLIDDISIRQFLLAPLEQRVSDIMDNKFVALRASERVSGCRTAPVSGRGPQGFARRRRQGHINRHRHHR